MRIRSSAAALAGGLLAAALLAGVPAASAAVAHPAIPLTCSGTVVSPHSGGNYWTVEANGDVSNTTSGGASQFCRIATTYAGYNYYELRVIGTSNCVREDASNHDYLDTQGCDPGDVAAQNWWIDSSNGGQMWDAYRYSGGLTNWDVNVGSPQFMADNWSCCGPGWAW